MKTLKTVSLFTGFLGLASALLATSAISAPGKGWDAFNVSQGDSIATASAYIGTSMGGAPGKGFDLFGSGIDEPLSASASGYMGTSVGGGTGQGWDVYNLGEGEKL